MRARGARLHGGAERARRERRSGRSVTYVCVVDVDLPGGALAACAALTGRPDAPPVVMLASSADPAAFVAAVRAGASGYLLDHLERGRLAEEVRAVAAGDVAVARPLVAYLLEELRGQRRRASAELTPRERDVLTLLGRGMTTKEIAARLDVRAPTVRRHLASAARKLGARDRQVALERFGRVHEPTERQ